MLHFESIVLVYIPESHCANTYGLDCEHQSAFVWLIMLWMMEEVCKARCAVQLRLGFEQLEHRHCSTSGSAVPGQSVLVM